MAERFLTEKAPSPNLTAIPDSYCGSSLPTLAEYIPLRSPRLQSPTHLAAMMAEGDRIIAPRIEQRFYWLSVPPRHWKTFTLRHIAAKHLEAWPEESVAWCTHTSRFANKQSRAVRRILAAAGVELSSEVNRQDEWELASGGGLMARGTGNAISGEGFRLAIIDDPFGSRKDAESQAVRDEVEGWIEDDILPRLTPDGAALLVHTRWHPDDAIGRYKRQSWPGMNLKALAEDKDDPLGREPGEALMPKVRPAEWLEAIRKRNPAKFASLYQGDPRPPGGRLFNAPVSYFREVPSSGTFSVGYGADLAYTADKRADRSFALQGQRFGEAIYFTKGIFAQVDATSFTPALKRFCEEPKAPCRWYTGGGGEKGVGQFLSQRIRQFNPLPATTDKYVRATPLAEAWNEGRVHLPAENSPYYGEWVEELKAEIAVFTGKNDPSDDGIDAAAACFDELMGGRSVDLGDEGLCGVVSDRWQTGDVGDEDDWDD